MWFFDNITFKHFLQKLKDLFQTKTDNTLNTTNKTVTGAINELKSNSHTHNNKAILDGITQDKVSMWDSTNADTVDNYHIWSGTQSEYDAITTKDANTIYLIKG